jgi:hypothetical protein
MPVDIIAHLRSLLLNVKEEFVNVAYNEHKENKEDLKQNWKFQ